MLDCTKEVAKRMTNDCLGFKSPPREAPLIAEIINTVLNSKQYESLSVRQALDALSDAKKILPMVIKIK